MDTVLLCVGLLVLLYALLSLNVSRIRLRTNEPLREKEAHLNQAVRAHGNAGEYIPLLAVLLLFLHHNGPGPLITIVAVAALASRALHAASMLWAPPAWRHRLRFVAALGTYACLVALGVVLVNRALLGTIGGV